MWEAKLRDRISFCVDVTKSRDLLTQRLVHSLSDFANRRVQKYLKLVFEGKC